MHEKVITHRIHVTGIFAYIWFKFMVNVGTYTSPMDPQGYTKLQSLMNIEMLRN